MWLFPSFFLPYFPQHRLFRLSILCRAGSTSLGLFPWGVPCSHEEIPAEDRHLEDLLHILTGIKLVGAECNAISFDSVKYLNEEQPVADWIQRSKVLKWSLHCPHRQVRGKVHPGGPLARPKRGPRTAPCIGHPLVLTLAADAPYRWKMPLSCWKSLPTHGALQPQLSAVPKASSWFWSLYTLHSLTFGLLHRQHLGETPALFPHPHVLQQDPDVHSFHLIIILL